ncbi:hypothetical protein ACMFMG_003269 [Clarireedia jacksonii]
MPRLWPDLDRWIAEGEMKKQPIMDRIDRDIEGCFHDDERQALQETFDSASTHNDDQNVILTESAFISLLTTKGSLPQSPEGVQAGKVIYAIVAYVSTLPFPRHQYDPSYQLDGLSLNELTRGLLWIIPGRHSYKDSEGDMGPKRGTADHLRLLFQSLSSPCGSKVQHEIKSRSTPFVEGQSLDNTSPDQGDPIFENLLDALYSTQEIQEPLMAPVQREKFKSVAQELLAENRTVLFSSLAIPAKRLEELVNVLLFLQYSTPELIPVLSEFNDAASSICAAFLKNSDNSLITWPMFEHGMKATAPYLFDPLYKLLSRTFLGDRSVFDVDDGSEVFIGPPNVLTIPFASQLYTFLAGSVCFETLECFNHFTSSNLPTSSALISAMESVPGEAILILSGTTSNRETVTFGLYSPKPKIDGSSIETNLIPSIEGLERCAIFQLSPVHDVFRGNIGKPGWTADDESVTFGGGSGVVMVLKDQLRRGEVRHRILDGDQMTGIYEADRWRGDWAVEFEIAEIAIWSEHPWLG